MTFFPRIYNCGDRALSLEFDAAASIKLSLEICEFCDRLEGAAIPGLVEIIPASASLTLIFEPLVVDLADLTARIEKLWHAPQPSREPAALYRIPVVYGGGKVCDLDEIATKLGTRAEEVIKLHAGQDYSVYMLGFLPGFAYLGDVAPKLRLDRLNTPRARVPQGSVAIASGFTAIYPLESPGGWHVLGWTPVRLWDLSRYERPLLKPGDKVRFYPVSAEEAEKLLCMVEEGWRPQAERG